MRFLTVFALFILPLSAFAQSDDPLPMLQGGNITVIPTPLGTSLWSSNGGNIEVIGKEPGNQMYFSYDRYGRANGMGMVNQPFVDRPLTLPEPLSQPNKYEPIRSR